MKKETKNKMIIDILLKHQGKENAITVQQIADMINRHDLGLTNPKTRFEIKDIIKREGLPIASCGKGYYLINTEEEYLEYVEQLKGRIKGIELRLRILENAWEYWNI